MGRLSGRGFVGPVIALAMVLAVAFPAGLMTTASAGPDATFTVTGDIDGCAKGEDTAELVAKTAGPIATVGDNAYPEATTEALKRCYEPSWGRFKDRTRPVPGNHDYEASKATPYFEYFGASAGEPGRGWYSYDVGAWHVVALNSNCDAVDCGQESTWLETDLRAHPSACIAAYWHHPRFSSGTSGGDEAVGAFWKVLYNHGASVVFNGHDHDYERFASQDPSGHRDPARGIREFVVGTGGASIGSFGGAAPNSEVRNNRSYGVLALTLRPGGYDWRFVSAAGDSFTDSGSDTCRGTAPAPAVAPSTAPSEPPPTAAPDPEPATPEEPAPSDSPATPPGPQEGSSKPRPTRPPDAAGRKASWAPRSAPHPATARPPARRGTQSGRRLPRPPSRPPRSRAT